MNKIILTVLLVVFAVCIYSQSWTQLNDFPGTQRDDGCSFTINNKAFCFTGLEVGWQCTGNGFVFDGNSETWSVMASLPSGKERQYATAFSYNGNGYLIGGLNGSNVCLKDFWHYSVAGNSWSSLPDFPGTGRQGMSQFVIKNKVYMIGGRDQNNITLNEVWEYDFTATNWTQKNDLPVDGMWRGGAFCIDTIGYVCYGMSNTVGSFNHFMYEYHHLDDTWTMVPGIILPARNYIGCAVTNGKACLYGGQDSLNVITNDVKLFDPMNASLTTLAGIPTIGRKGTMAFALNDVFYLTTGLDATQTRIKETWKNTSFVGIKENGLKPYVNFYPNPANDGFNVVLNNTSNATIQLFDSLGALIFETILIEDTTKINTTLYSSGIYFMIIKTKEGLSSKKIIITH